MKKLVRNLKLPFISGLEKFFAIGLSTAGDTEGLRQVLSSFVTVVDAVMAGDGVKKFKGASSLSATVDSFILRKT